MSNPLSYEKLNETLQSSSAAFRSISRLQPAGGRLDKVFPPTYKGAEYAKEQRLLERPNGHLEAVACVVLDSVQSQANRFEPALLELREEGRISLPTIRIDFDHPDLLRKLSLTSHDLPHRIADALLRDSLLDGVKFRESEVGKVLDSSDLKNATGLFKYCPHALLFGLWDSTGPRGGLGAKFQRAIVSEIVAYNCQFGVRTSSRIDPTQIVLKAGPLYDDGQGSYVTDEQHAKLDKSKKPIRLGKEGKPSEANLGNVTPSINKDGGGVNMEFAQQTIVLSLPALRRLRFPISGKWNRQVDVAARSVLAALGLLAATYSQEQGYDLRSRCLLVPEDNISWEIIATPGQPPVKFSWTSEHAIELYNDSVKAAKKLGLPWQEDTIEVLPSPQLLELVKRSQQQLVSGAIEDEA